MESFRALLAFDEPATLPVEHGQIVVTTSTFAVHPLVFPGGDIGRLATCERWGVDPLQMASAGRIVAVVPAADAARALDAVRAHPLGDGAAIVGELVARPER